MEKSILKSIKKLLGIAPDYTEFDVDIIMHINSVFSILHQLGFGDKAFVIEDDTAEWDDVVEEKNLEMIKSYMYAKVRMQFDPPTSTAVAEAMKRMIDEYEFRINSEVDYGKEDQSEIII